MQKRIFSLLMLLWCIVSLNSVYAANEAHVGDRVAYSGTLTRVYMNGEKASGQAVKAFVTKTSEHTYTIELQEFKAGKMPGTIQVIAKDVSVSADGSFNMPSMQNIIMLKLFVLFKTKSSFNASLSGTITSDGRLTFTVTSVNAKYFGIPFKALVPLKGHK